MAINYTYDDFTKALAQSGLSGQFSDADLRLAAVNPNAGMTILNAKIGYGNATSDAERASFNTIAENARRTAGGYTGGTDGSSYFLAPASPSSFTPKTAAPTYQNRYEDDIRAALSAVTNPAPFSYSAESDDVYKQYAKAYRREGQRATADTLGQAAAATGGIPSSYAATAAAQAGNYYAAQLADKIPELNQMAYQRYLNDYAMRQSALDALLTVEQSDYNKYLNDRSQYNADRSFDYNQFIDEITHQQGVEQRARDNRNADAVLAADYGDYALLQTLGINTTALEEREKLSRALELAKYGDYSLLRELGYDTSRLEWEDAFADAVEAAKLGDYTLLEQLGFDTSALRSKEETQTDVNNPLYTYFMLGYWNRDGVRNYIQNTYGVSPELLAEYMNAYEGTNIVQKDSVSALAGERPGTPAARPTDDNRFSTGFAYVSPEMLAYQSEENFIAHMINQGYDGEEVGNALQSETVFKRDKREGLDWTVPFLTYADYLRAVEEDFKKRK